MSFEAGLSASGCALEASSRAGRGPSLDLLAVIGFEVGAVGLVGPAWTRGEIKKPAGKKDMGGWQALVPHSVHICAAVKLSYTSHVSRCIPLSSKRARRLAKEACGLFPV